MSGWVWFTFGAVSAGPLFAGVLWLLLGEAVYRRGVLAGQAQAERAHDWRGDLYEPARRRWGRLDRNQNWAATRPVFHDHTN